MCSEFSKIITGEYLCPRIDFFLVAKDLTPHVKKKEIYPSIAPDLRAIYISLSWTTEKSRGPALWKFNNTLLKDEHYLSKIRETYSRTRAVYSDLADARLHWEMLKMDIRAVTIAYSKKKAKGTTNRELEIRRQLEILDRNICDNFNFPNIAHILNEYEDLKMELQSIYEEKRGGGGRGGRQLFLDRNVAWSKRANVQQSTFSIWRKETTTGRPSLNWE